MKSLKIEISVFILIFLFSCNTKEEYKIVRYNSGPFVTASYLLYGIESKEAALFDVGVNTDTLLKIINDEKLKLKYVFVTHAHQDHIFGLPEIKKKFPDVKFGISKTEFEDINYYSNWENVFAEQDVEIWKQYPSAVELMNFDYSKIGDPDIFLDEERTYNLGKLKICILNTPGHSRGSVSYCIENILLTGDLIVHKRDGYLNYELSSKELIMESVSRLYDLFPDETIIYPGHGPETTIGSEKKENKTVSLEKINAFRK